MMGHKICVNEIRWVVIPKLSLLPLLVWSTVIESDVSYFITGLSHPFLRMGPGPLELGKIASF